MAEKSMRHAEDDQLEKYAMGALAEEESAMVEEHLLICPECQDRLSETDRYIYAMRSAAAELRREPETRRWALLDFTQWRWPALAAAFGVLAIAVGIGIQHDILRRGDVPVAVALRATRGADSLNASAPSKQPLELSLDLTGLRDLPSYRVELVGARGETMLQASVRPSDSKLVVTVDKRLPAGTYFARIYTPAGQLLREYGLQLTDRR